MYQNIGIVQENQINMFTHIKGAINPSKILWLKENLENSTFYDMKSSGRNDVVLHLSEKDTIFMSKEVYEHLGSDMFEKVKKQADELAGCKTTLVKTLHIPFMKYQKKSYIGRHADTRDYVSNKFISAVCYINDNYEGGELLIFDGIDEVSKIKPCSGDVVLLGHGVQHEAMTVNSGEKYIFVIYFDIDEKEKS